MSASSRPEISAWPSSLTSALTRDLGRGLVVEAGEGDAVGVGPDQQAGQDRHARSDRQAARRPLHGLGQHVPLESDLHAVLLAAPWSGRDLQPGAARVGRAGHGDAYSARPAPTVAPDRGSASRQPFSPRQQLPQVVGRGQHLVLQRDQRRSIPAGIAPVNTGRTSKTRSSTSSRVGVPLRMIIASPASRLYSLTRPRQPGLSMVCVARASPRPARRAPSPGAAAGAAGASTSRVIGHLVGLLVVPAEQLLQKAHGSSSVGRSYTGQVPCDLDLSSPSYLIVLVVAAVDAGDNPR